MVLGLHGAWRSRDRTHRHVRRSAGIGGGGAFAVLISLLLMAAPVEATGALLGTLTVVPEAGPAGTIFLVQGSGYPHSWAAGRLEVAVRPAPPATAPPPTVEGSIGAYVDATGRFQTTLDSTGLRPGRYTVFVWSQHSPDEVITEATIVITPTAPTLPGAGGGMVASSRQVSRHLVLGAGILFIISGALAALRYRSRRLLFRSSAG